MLSLILIGIVVFLLVILSFVWPPDSPWSPRWRIKRSSARLALQFVKVKKTDIVYELGCGDGEFILTAAEEFGAKSKGIEIDPARFCVSLVRAKFSSARKKISVVRKDFKKVDLSDATVVYMYLVPAAMKRLLPQLKKQLDSGTHILSYRYQIPLTKNEKWIKKTREEHEEKLFLYTIT
jgi:SAM-dependent methyltransferase